MYEWIISERDEVKRIILLILPWMGKRRSEKMIEALDRLSKNRGINKPIQHGTVNGYKMETYRKTGHCDPCRKAMNNHNKELLERRSGNAKPLLNLSVKYEK